MGNKHIIGFIIGMIMWSLGTAYEIWAIALFGVFLVIQIQIHLFNIEPKEEKQ